MTNGNQDLTGLSLITVAHLLVCAVAQKLTRARRFMNDGKGNLEPWLNDPRKRVKKNLVIYKLSDILIFKELWSTVAHEIR